MNEIKFDNTYVKLDRKFYEEINPQPVKKPKLIKLNSALLDYLDIDPNFLRSKDGLNFLSGNSIVKGSKPIALAYAGHQFGNFVPKLGDGRAVLLGEIIAKDGKRFDIQLKGSGKTSFSRQGDGRSPLGPVIREYLVSEAMYYLNIPSTRSLSIVSTGELVERENFLPGGILTRVAASHIRIGTFEYFFSRNDFKSVKILADYSVKRHYPHIKKEKKNLYETLFKEIIKSQAKLVALWMSKGFIHGVMNTDNTTISGETIDYGPCAFMDNFHPQKVFSYIDVSGRYSYSNQAQIMLWNLSILGQCLAPLISNEKKKSEKIIIDSLQEFSELFQNYWFSNFKKKLGLTGSNEQADKKLIENFLKIIFEQNVDFTLSFRYLSDDFSIEKKNGRFFSLFKDHSEIKDWLKYWKKRIGEEKNNFKITKENMRKVNPIYIPRNHLVEKVIDQATEKKDFSLLNKLLIAIKNPYEEREINKTFAIPPTDEEVVRHTFCGT